MTARTDSSQDAGHATLYRVAKLPALLTAPAHATRLSQGGGAFRGRRCPAAGPLPVPDPVSRLHPRATPAACACPGDTGGAEPRELRGR